jgi:hypothetical protein
LFVPFLKAKEVPVLTTLEENLNSLEIPWNLISFFLSLRKFPWKWERHVGTEIISSFAHVRCRLLVNSTALKKHDTNLDKYSVVRIAWSILAARGTETWSWLEFKILGVFLNFRACTSRVRLPTIHYVCSCRLNLANVRAKVILIGHWSDHKKKLSHTFFCCDKFRLQIHSICILQ